jgi:ATP-binding cassette subfamily F protein 3
LDIETIKWLEECLGSYRGALLLISHDRRFLDSITDRTVEIVLGNIHDYKVSYSKYKELRKERFEQQRAAFENQQRMIDKTEEFIERFRYKATKSNQVQSRIKQLEKLDRIEIEEDDNSALHLKFPPAPRSGQVAVTTKNLAMSYGQKKIFSGVDLVVERGEKIALLGKNGEGKTTFMRLLTRELTPVNGSITLGHNVSMGYYAQNQDELLDTEDTVFGTLDKVAVGDVRKNLRDILGAFLFRGEDVDKKVKVLSGGEKARLAMAKLILKPYNLLALDEPTNHMDITSKDILKRALQSYQGTLVLVSHDRDFLDGLADKVYEFKDGSVKEYLGGLTGFLERKNISSIEQLEQEPNQEGAQSKIAENTTQVKTEAAVSYQQQKEIEREAKRKKARIEKCEEEISALEERISEKEELLSVNDNNLSLPRILEEYAKLKEALDDKLQEWESLHG